MRRRVCLAASVLLMSGCEHAPAVNILGSFFPIWLVCIVLGILAAVGMRAVLMRMGPDVDYGPAVLIYPSAAVLTACLVWLIFFR